MWGEFSGAREYSGSTPIMEKCKEIILRLGKNRNIPQLFYCGEVTRGSVTYLRQAVRSFLKGQSQGEEVDVVINSPGGDADAAYKIITILKRRFKKVNVVVPFWAKSAATLLSLGAHQIIIDELGEFGPLDPQIPKPLEDSPDFDFETSLVDESALQLIEEKSQMQFMQMFRNIHEFRKIRLDRKELSRQIFHYLSEFYTPLLTQIDPYKMGQKSRITKIAIAYALRIVDSKKVQNHRLVYYLANECPDHGFVVDFEQLKEYGVPIKLSDEIGPEYESILRELSDYLSLEFDHRNSSFVGFVEEAQEKDPDISVEAPAATEDIKSSTTLKQNGKSKVATS
jgi:hypothetical protein